MKKRIAIDIDGTIGNLVTPVLMYYNRRFGTNFKGEDVDHIDFWKVWGIKKGEDLPIFDDFYNSSEFEQVLPIEGSQEGVSRLFVKGYELSIVTSRPDNLKEKTFNWLEENFPNVFSEIHFVSSNKFDICLERGYLSLIEDSPSHAYECAEKGISVYLMKQRWNRGTSHKNILRVKNWYDLLQKLK